MTDEEVAARIRAIRLIPQPFLRPSRVRRFRLAALVEVMRELDGEPFDFHLFAEAIHLSHVAARRYVQELQAAGLLDPTISIPEKMARCARAKGSTSSVAPSTVVPIVDVEVIRLPLRTRAER